MSLESILPLSGWLLDRAVEIDFHQPGFAGYVLRCSNERRNHIAAYLSTDHPTLRFTSTAEMARYLSSADHEAILQAAFGVVPSGFRSALRRGGASQYHRRFYRYLWALLISESRPDMPEVISQLPEVNPTRLKITRVLDRDLRFPTLVTILRGPEDARDLSMLVGLLVGVGADRGAMVQALSQVRSIAGLGEFAKRWAFRANLPPHPVPANDEYRPIVFAGDLQKVAVRFRNCMRSFLCNALEERSAFAIFSNGRHEVVLHLARERGDWELEGIYGHRNQRPDQRTALEAISYLARHGVTRRKHFERREGGWLCLRKLAEFDDYPEDLAHF